MKLLLQLVGMYALGVATLAVVLVGVIQVDSYDCTRRYHAASCQRVVLLPWEAR
ncbi:hypothetical protein [Mesorhizobium sp. M0859]|uniref:hypothetical protein n=1 Tax=Mesorhizobium sp. M0859 TaxID=2957014 RepID=UPI0033378993